MTAAMIAEQWPHKGGELIRVAIAMSALSMLSTIWRLIMRFRVNPIMGVSDWLMLAGTVMSFVGNIGFFIRTAHAGAGRLSADPFWTSERTDALIHLEFIAICLQIYAMFLVKMSVCTYLLALNFSRKFRVVIWIVTLVVVLFNLVMPLLFHFWSCRPYYFRWNPDVVAECWPELVGTITEYAQIVSNMCTDLVYVSSPLVYLRQAKLTKLMRCNVKFMFLLALVGTSSSVLKIYYMYRWLHSSEPFYDIIELHIWGINEIAICIVIANLPMQRRCIGQAVTFIIPDSLQARLGCNQDQERIEDELVTGEFDISRRSRNSEPIADDGSEMAIIELENGRIVLAPKPATSTSAKTNTNQNRGTLTTFWRNESKDSIT